MAGMAMAERSPEHVAATHEAMARANRVRLERAEVRGEIAGLPKVEGRERVAALIADPPACCASATVGDVLVWVRQTARSTMRRQLGGVARESAFSGVAVVIPEGKRLDAPTVRQRRALAAYLRGEEVVA